MKKVNMYSGLVVILIAAIFYSMTLSFPVQAVEETGPAFIPRIYSGILIFLGILLVIQSLREKNELERVNMMTISLVIGLVFVYVFFIQFIGFYIATFLFLVTFLWFMKVRKMAVLLGVPISVMLVVFIFFQKILVVPIPLGSLFS
ncbi:tripartite tricarboxylate transporter TctB family protein [bacterium LRH843]|nr:tripartite tricarboxylate transporter TctB family protein [bacterium LRH843]